MRLFRRRPEGPIQDWQPRLYAILIGLVLIVAYVIAFIIKNSHKVTIHFVLFSTRTSLIWLIILLLAIGALVGVLVSQLYRRRSSGGAAKKHGGSDG